MRTIQPFVALALKVCDKMGIQDSNSQKLVMRFCKLYEAEKIVRITHHALGYPWHEKNPKAAFMKAVGEINKIDKQGKEK